MSLEMETAVTESPVDILALWNMDVDKDSSQAVYDKVLKNHLIVEKLCSFSTIEDMKMMRSVCYHWKYQVGPILFKRAWCSLQSDEGHLNDISRYMRVADANPNLKLIKNFRFKYMNLTDTNLKKTNTIKFFERFGKHLKGLILKRCCIDKGGEFWTNLIRISRWTNELQELILEENCFIAMDTPPDSWGLPSRHKITTLRFFSDKTEAAFPCALGDIWKEFPILETLQLVDLTEDDNLVLLESMNPGKFKNSKPKLVLQDLDMFGEKEYSVREIPRNQLKLFCELKLPLTKMTIDIGENILSGNFQQMLLAYGPTLKELVIWRGLLANKIKPPGFPFGVTLPVLEFLEVPESCIVNFNFIHHFPKLIRLTVRQCDLNPISYETDLFAFRYSYKEWRTFVHEPCKTLLELKIEFKVNEENIEFLRGIFPNLRTLTTFLTQESEMLVF